MTIYMVCGNNNESYEDYVWWNDRAFTTKEAAMDYIRHIPDFHTRDMDRVRELHDLRYIRGLSRDELMELDKLEDKWYWYAGAQHYEIEEIELSENCF